MDLIRIDDHGRLFISPDIENWQAIEEAGIGAVIDLDGGLDIGVPTAPDKILYLYFPINDSELPEPSKLHAVARFGATLIEGGHRVLSHCGLGYNRSALVAGLILMYTGMKGADCLNLLREKRPGALYNRAFADYLCTCVPEKVESRSESR